MNRDLNLLNSYVKTLAEKLIAECKNKGIEIIVIGTYRSIEEQNKLYAQGRTEPGNIVTNAKGGYSIHNFGYAFDIAVKINGAITWDNKYYTPVGEIGKSIGLEWGGDFKTLSDPGHFQYTQGLSTSDFRKGKRPIIPMDIRYKAHVQDIGWQEEVKNGEIAGTVGQSLRLEALTIDCDNKLEIEVHVQDKGWMPVKTNGEIVGTVGESLRIEAIKIKVEGRSVAYRVHVEGMGWMDWSYNGEVAGTVGRSLRVEAIRIKIE